MAFKNLSTGRKGYPFDFAEFICDKEDDVASLPTHINKNGYRDTVCAGSIAFVVDTSTYYMLNTLNDWVEVDIGSSGGGGGSGSGVEIDDENISENTTFSSSKLMEILKNYQMYINITVQLQGSNGGVPTGNYVNIYEVSRNGEDILVYTVPCPLGVITVKLPHGIEYKITATVNQEGFYAPVPVTGVAVNDGTVTVRYTELAYPQSIRDLQILAQLGLASEVVEVGDEFSVPYVYNGETFDAPWIVVDIKDTLLEDGRTVQGVWMEWKYATIENLQFDKEEQEIATEENAIDGLTYIGKVGNTYSLINIEVGSPIPYADYDFVYHNEIKDTSLNMYRYGYNRYTQSAMRQWLNSNASKGQWWVSQHIGDTAPNSLNTYAGFVAGLPQEFVDCVVNAKHTLYTNSVTDGSVIDTYYDKFFLLTGTELYGSVNDNEGDYMPYYKAVTGLTSPKNDANTGRVKFALNSKTSAQYCFCSSSIRGNSSNVWIRRSSGQLYYNLANSANRACPACIIG